MSERARLEDFRPLARWIGSSYFLPGADSDDVEQEAMIGVFKALRDYREGQGMTLRSFVELCVRRQLITAVITARRVKHETLTWATRVVVNDEGERVDAVELVADDKADPARIVGAREEARRILRVVRDELSPLERRALIGVANGMTYVELAEKLGLPVRDRGGFPHAKAIDNAITRARRKLTAAPPTWRQLAAA